MSQRFVFRFADFLLADDLLSEWIATSASRFNGLSLLGEQMDVDAMVAHRYLYWLRLSRT
jgi:hypothetical protein